MKMRSLRRIKTLAPRNLRRSNTFDLSDATMEADPGPPPEAVFDRVTGPWDRRRSSAMPGGFDEET
ncbi:MAG TPA: hypothetical protein VGM39_02630 [Kofleriaceae bacterium]|jgi:hypothetical protein